MANTLRNQLGQYAGAGPDGRPVIRASRQRWQNLDFGEFADLSLPMLAVCRPLAFYELLRTVELTPSLALQAREVVRRAAHIKAPAGCDFVISIRRGALRQFGWLGTSDIRPSHCYWRSPHLDLAIVHCFRPEDRDEAEQEIRAVFHSLCFDWQHALTQADAESFFDNDANFDLACSIDHCAAWTGKTGRRQLAALAPLLVEPN